MRVYSAVWCFVLIAGCGGGDEKDPIAGGNAVCDVDSFTLQGTLGSDKISYHGELGSYAWVQFGSSNSLDADLLAGGHLRATWDHMISEGSSADITGAITLPSGGARSGAPFNVGSGLLSKLGDEVRFDLGSLSESVQCFAPPCPQNSVAGGLQGCIHWQHQGP